MSKMKFYQSVHWRLTNLANTVSLRLGRFSQFVSVEPSYRTDKVHLASAILICSNIAFEEFLEAIYDEIMNFFVIAVSGAKRRQACQESVWHRLSVHLFNDRRYRQLGLFEKTSAYCVRKLLLQASANEPSTNVGTASFITEYESQRRHIVCYAVAVEIARIRSCS